MAFADLMTAFVTESDVAIAEVGVRSNVDLESEKVLTEDTKSERALVAELDRPRLALRKLGMSPVVDSRSLTVSYKSIKACLADLVKRELAGPAFMAVSEFRPASIQFKFVLLLERESKSDSF